jgi:hypothetical protein
MIMKIKARAQGGSRDCGKVSKILLKQYLLIKLLHGHVYISEAG